MSGSSLLELQDVSFGYGEGQSFVPVLDNVTSVLNRDSASRCSGAVGRAKVR